MYHHTFKDNRDAIVKMLPFYLLSLFIPFLVTPAFAKNELLDFMTPRDLLHAEANSNISLINNRGGAVTVYGLYVRQFSYVTPGDTCANATIMYDTTQNTTSGAFVMPTVINAGKSAIVGSNYLYNMIYEANYFLSILSSANCALPGCTWGTDMTMYNWCIYLGALAPVSTSAGYTANVPPSASAASSGGSYDYNLINNFVYLGPISCNDKTLTCTVANKQTQSIS